MRYGFWMPVFGGWLRNVDDENMEASWAYTRRLAQRAEQLGYDLSLIAELNLNDIKGVEAPSLDAWSTAAALAAVTEKLEIMVAVRPTFHNPALLAKQAANIDHISNGRLTLNVVSSWWADEATKYGLHFDQHDDRYARTNEWLDVLNGCWSQQGFSYEGKFYNVADNVLSPKPVRKPRPTLYAGGESETAKNLIAGKCDAYLMHGDSPARVGEKIADMRERRERAGLGPMVFGVAGYAVVRDTPEQARKEVIRITDVQQSAQGYKNYQQWVTGSKLEQKISLEDYSVSNRGLRSGLVGSPDQVKEQIAAFAEVGVDLLLLQSSPQLEEMERFAEQVMPARIVAGAENAGSTLDAQLTGL
ncbi:LLM class flavin-dependent oxidoreductase [Acidipila sp. EB88]|uniref:LLM class flavin-dependent oxidoreductase n=1 Tax=Acidipila sp. EB88 TaxID=2305226 RepID=UPI000F5DD9DD|nr:LLM class flavin-dependent oxidoreductase [Acidipila sp. EB88]RRA48401.1 LLM class flavin-dependent oxidoreductase [Acidipila sp. EB88]